MGVLIKDVISHLEQLAPPSLQESYDNSRLIVGDDSIEVTGIITSLDCLENVVEEAIEKKCNLIVAHHPIVFSGLKTFTGKNYIERTVIKAIQNNIAIYAIHTNLDNVIHGVNGVWGKALGLTNQKVLSPKQGLLNKLAVYVPQDHSEVVKNAMFSAGAGSLGDYAECSFESAGTGTFLPGDDTKPFIGAKGTRSSVTESKIEVIVPSFNVSKVLKAMEIAHPYEEVAYDLYSIQGSSDKIGSGLIGELPEEMDAIEFLKMMKQTMGAGVVRHTKVLKDKVKRIAICGGSGSFLLDASIAQQADIFITADYKYHQFFDADNRIVIADIGHYESEHLTINYLADNLNKKFTTFAVSITQADTNPIEYL
jgi:dinuclear metal center YbgI/SA1388 family protein